MTIEEKYMLLPPDLREAFLKYLDELLESEVCYETRPSA